MLRAAAIGEADFAVATWTPRPHGELRSELLWKEPLILCASPHGPPDADAINLSDMTAPPYVGVPRDVAFHDMVERQLQEYGIGVATCPAPWPRRADQARRRRQRLGQPGAALRGRRRHRERTAADRTHPRRRTHRGIGLFLREGVYLSPLKRAAIDAIRTAAPDT